MPRSRVIQDIEDFPIKPRDIDASQYMWDAFGNMETDISAGYIVRLMQERGDWVPFTYGEINAFYKRTCTSTKPEPGDYSFNHLLGVFNVVTRPGESYRDRLDVIVHEGGEENPSWRRPEESDVFRVTDEFVCRCYQSAGIPRVKQVPQPA